MPNYHSNCEYINIVIFGNRSLLNRNNITKNQFHKLSIAAMYDYKNTETSNAYLTPFFLMASYYFCFYYAGETKRDGLTDESLAFAVLCKILLS